MNQQDRFKFESSPYMKSDSRIVFDEVAEFKSGEPISLMQEREYKSELMDFARKYPEAMEYHLMLCEVKRKPVHRMPPPRRMAQIIHNLYATTSPWGTA